LAGEVTWLVSAVGQVEIPGCRLTLMFRAARLRSEVYLMSPERSERIR